MNNNPEIFGTLTSDHEHSDSVMPIGIIEEFDELQVETPWEIFNMQINNWNAINYHASEK